MWSRVKLKNNAKKILLKNYWWIVLVTIILGIAVGQGTPLKINVNLNDAKLSSDIGFTGNSQAGSNSYFDEIMGNTNNSETDIFSDGENQNLVEIVNAYFDRMFGGLLGNMSPTGLMFLTGMLGFMALAAILVQIFVLAPLEVGCKRWFLQNRTDKPNLSEILYAFKNGYLNVVKVMFCVNLFTFLWSLLLFIPGIIKSYEYRMIPYLLAENPEMDMHEAFMRSREMMTGNKWETFVLDLSFFGWTFLSAFTCGILGILYVFPYINLTNTELYVELCSLGRESGEQYNY